MDNLCHTLAGAALARAGLDRRTPLAMPTLLVAANLPDVDVLAYLRDPLFALTFRRGWTHGVLAMAVLPVGLAGVMVAWDRMLRLRWRPGAKPAPPRDLLLVSLVGVLSHSLLDLLNTYGVRLLMPVSDRWFYGDTLFIIDAWLSGLLAMAWLVGWGGRGRERAGEGRSGSARRARLVLGLAGLYIGGMFALGQVARRSAAREAAAIGIRPARIMASPVPVDPLRRSVLLDLGGSYRWGSFDWRRPAPRSMLEPHAIPRNFEHPAVAAALEQPDGRAFRRWSRFPAAATFPGGVRLYDLRYADADADSWASVWVPP
ncbi:MAG: metal-dependent hydrolase [Gemmatimonadales bacterium]